MSETSQTYQLPTHVAVQRYLEMKVEAVLNTPYQITDDLTPMEHCLTQSSDPEATVGILGLPQEQHEIAVDFLNEALTEPDLEDLYGLRGGVLNIFMPRVYQHQDNMWKDLYSSGLTTEQFVHRPNELFGSLSVAQVWAGAGKLEMALADAFLPKTWEKLKAKKFPLPGMANLEWLNRLRLWSYNPARGGLSGRVVDVILNERDENCLNKIKLCRERGLPNIFNRGD